MKALQNVNLAAALSLFIAGLLSIQPAHADGDPYAGYSDTTSYMLNYSSGSFTPGNTNDVQVDVTIGGIKHPFNVDTGSRGLYASSEELGSSVDLNAPGAYAGEIDLSSSGRVSSGMWVSTTMSFDVVDNNNAHQTVTSTANILDVTTLGAQMDRTAFFGTTVTSGSITLVGGGSVNIAYDDANQAYGIKLTQNATENQQVTYAANPGLLSNASNFGIGFDLNGAAGGTGPVGNNMNQIYNPLINLDSMKNGTLVAGYIVKSTGIQLGLTSTDKGYAYTSLTPTGFTSTNSTPDWQTPMGQTTVSGTTNLPGSIVMDSGIPNAFISAPNLTVGGTITTMSVDLMNSGGAAGYKIDLTGTGAMNPTSILVVNPGSDGIYTQNQPPYQGQFFNTGRNVFDDFNMLYDAQDGYMGVLPNDYGTNDPNVYFSAQAGGFPNPLAVPETQPTTLLLMGLITCTLLGLACRKQRNKSS